MFLEKASVTSGGSRNITKFKTDIFDKRHFKKLSFKQPSKAGRGRNGRIIIFSKTSLKARFRAFNVNYNWRCKKIAMIASFTLIPFSNKLISLVFLASGAASYLPAQAEGQIFSFNYFPIKGLLKPFFPRPTFFLMHHMKQLAKVSMVEIFPGAGAKYARSAGVFAKIIRVNYDDHICVVKLPSGVKRNISIYSTITRGPAPLRDARRVKNTKAGYWRTKGCKSMVRGVARNPVDHPHGGRTKAIKNPRTPWGKPTKLK